MRRFAAKALLLTLFLTAGYAWIGLDKSVAVEVDGDVRNVRTWARTVGDVLDRAGLTVGEHDIVAPDVARPVKDRHRIVLRRGRPVELVLNGQRRTVWVTALSVDEALSQLGVRSAANAFVSASRSRRIPLDGMAFEVRTPARVRILVDGAERTVTSTARTVGELLALHKVPLAKTDVLSVPGSTYPRHGLTIKITRIRGGVSRETISLPYQVERRNDSSIYRGSTRTLVDGKVGLRERVYRLTLTDGRVSRRQLVSDRLIRQPRTKVVLVGTKPRPFYMTVDTSSVDHLNWRALAYCESGNNPRAIGGGGAYRGLYQFTMGTWRGLGGYGDPIDASREEQTYRAKVLYMRRGAGPWPYCGRRL